MNTQVLQNKKLLIADDEGDICLLLNIMLADKETSIEHVKTIAAVKDFLKTNTPDILVLDNKLPDGWGSEHVEELKQAYPSLKVLMISGISDDVKVQQIKQTADGFLPKPFTKQQMKDSLANLFTENVAS